MDKRRILGVTLLLAAAAAVVTVNGRFEAAQQAEEAAYQAYLDTLPVAQVEGEVLSPDGRFRAEMARSSIPTAVLSGRMKMVPSPAPLWSRPQRSCGAATTLTGTARRRPWRW